MPKEQKTEERKAFKDYFDRDAALMLADQLAAVYRQFDRSAFVKQSARGLGKLEFNDRVKQFSAAMRATLPNSISKAMTILRRSLPTALPDCENPTDGWLQWPIGQFVADYGIEENGDAQIDVAFELMIELTQRFSSEFAVRPFVEYFPGETFRRLKKLAKHKNPHVRRWCSEGVRPRLPWGKKLTALVKAPDPIFPILDLLKDDEELYVRRSVANNLNDIAKDHPKRVIDLCKKWSKGADENLKWTIEHALRTLVKDGNPGALNVIGFKTPKSIDVTLSVKPRKIKIGDSVTLNASIKNRAKTSQPLLVDYSVGYVRKSGASNDKVFKWKKLDIAAGQTLAIEKKHSMKTTTIRVLYPGRHSVSVQVNGVVMAESSFTLAD